MTDIDLSHFDRQMGIINPQDLANYTITIIGAGGIGSWTVLSLAKMGFTSINVIDFDKIENANFGPQFYTPRHLGQNKVNALAKRIEDEMGYPVVRGIHSDWKQLKGKDQIISDTNILIMAVDDMDTRRKIWEDVKLAGLQLIIEARMAREMMEINVIDPNNDEHIKHFEIRLFPSSDIKEEIPCTERAVAYNQFVIAGIISSAIKQFIRKELDYKQIRFDLHSMTLLKS